MKHGYQLLLSGDKVWHPFKKGQRYVYSREKGPRRTFPDELEPLREGEYVHVVHDNAIHQAIVIIRNDTE